MDTLARRRLAGLRTSAILALAVSGAGALWAQQTATTPATEPATQTAVAPATTTRPGVSNTATMRFVFTDAPVDTVLNQLSERFGFIIIKPGPVPGRITINNQNEVNADQAVRLLNEFLVPLGFATLETRTEGAPVDHHTLFRMDIYEE